DHLEHARPSAPPQLIGQRGRNQIAQFRIEIAALGVATLADQPRGAQFSDSRLSRDRKALAFLALTARLVPSCAADDGEAKRDGYADDEGFIGEHHGSPSSLFRCKIQSGSQSHAWLRPGF